MARIGRPIEKPDATLVQEILDWIEDGQTLRAYCRQKGKPTWKTVYLWLAKDEDFATRYARAREAGQEAIAQETLEIIDEQPSTIVGDGGVRYDSAAVAWQRNRVEQRMKLLAVWNPRKYGAKVDLTSEGKQVGFNITVDLSEGERK